MFHNLPNLLTCIRLILVPVVGERLFRGDYRSALLLVFIAGVTDGFDGWLARHYHWTSRTGAWLDPLADKVLLVTVYILLGVDQVIPMWLAVLVPARDVFILSMVAAGLVFTQVRDFPPSVAGKVSTIIQVGAAVALLADAAAGRRLPGQLVEIVILITAVATVWSGLDYAWRGFRTLLRLRIDAGNPRR